MVRIGTVMPTPRPTALLEPVPFAGEPSPNDVAAFFEAARMLWRPLVLIETPPDGEPRARSVAAW